MGGRRVIPVQTILNHMMVGVFCEYQILKILGRVYDEFWSGFKFEENECTSRGFDY